MRTFVDTGGWVAYFNPSDMHHENARSLIEHALGSRDDRLVTMVEVMVETVTLLRYKEGHAIAARALESLLDLMRSSGVDWYWTDQKLLASAAETFHKFDDQAFSMTDCISFALCKALGITQAATPDSHFEIMGIARVGIRRG